MRNKIPLSKYAILSWFNRILMKIYSSGSPLHFFFNKIVSKTGASTHTQKKKQPQSRLYPSDATLSVFKTILCKSLSDLINAFCRYETMSVYGIYRTIRNVIWWNRIRNITKCNRFSCW